MAFVPFVLIIYFHLEYPSAIVIPIYGFLLLVLKKHKLFSYQEAVDIQKMFGVLIIFGSLFINIALQTVFPWTAYYGAVNYATHLLGLFLVFFDVTALKEAFTPIFLILATSASSMVSRWTEPYFKPFLPFFTKLIVAFLNTLGMKATIIHTQFSNTFILYTPRFQAFYRIIWACLGIESALTFAIVLIIILWEEPGRLKTKILWSIVGLLGTLFLNIFRVVLILVTEYIFGSGISTTVHYSVGYVLFIVWITAFLYIFSKREAIQGKIKLFWQKLSLNIRKVP